MVIKVGGARLRVDLRKPIPVRYGVMTFGMCTCMPRERAHARISRDINLWHVTKAKVVIATTLLWVRSDRLGTRLPAVMASFIRRIREAGGLRNSFRILMK